MKKVLILSTAMLLLGTLPARADINADITLFGSPAAAEDSPTSTVYVTQPVAYYPAPVYPGHPDWHHHYDYRYWHDHDHDWHHDHDMRHDDRRDDHDHGDHGDHGDYRH